MQKQLNSYVNKLISPISCGYKKEYSTQFALINLIDKCKISFDQKGFTGPVLMDLSKTFDTINQEPRTSCV